MIAVNENVNASEIRDLLGAVCDPEIPVLTIADLGVLRDVRIDGNTVVVVITPTYTGCPAMRTIESDIVETLRTNGYADVRVETQIAPAWTTDWLSDAGREKLRQVGIAPPATGSRDKRHLVGRAPVVNCPQCGSTATQRVSEFGSTACKALYRCDECLEPFDYFKCI